MPIVNSYQAAPTAVADFAQDIGYVQEKARQVASQKAYTNHLAEINLRYQNQSELQRQAALQRAALTKQENEYREEFANKQMQRNLYSTAAELEMRGDYQSRIIAEQFKSNADMMKAREKIQKETQGWSYSDSAKRQQMEIKQQMQKIEQAENISPQDKRSELAKLRRQLDTMVPDKEPENYVAPNTIHKDEDTGKKFFIDSNGKPQFLTYADGSTQQEYEANHEDNMVDKRAKYEINKIKHEYAFKEKLEAIKAKNDSNQLRAYSAFSNKVKGIESAANKLDNAAQKLLFDVDKSKQKYAAMNKELLLLGDRIINDDYSQYENGEQLKQQDKDDYEILGAKVEALRNLIKAKQNRANELLKRKDQAMRKVNIMKQSMLEQGLKSTNKAEQKMAIAELRAAVARKEPWAIEYVQSHRSKQGSDVNLIASNME